METILRTGDSIKVVEMQEVVKEEYSRDELKQELEAINSEIKNFEIIQERRMETLLARKQKIKALLN
jgi:hypothetical protein